LSPLLESLPAVAVASYHDIEVDPATREAFPHFRHRFRAPGVEPGAEPEAELIDIPPLPLAAQVPFLAGKGTTRLGESSCFFASPTSYLSLVLIRYICQDPLFLKEKQKS
jgi:hypothetical protein